MIRNVLEHVGGIATFPIAAFALFMLVFVGMLVWVSVLRRPHLDHMSHLPLQDDRPIPPQGGLGR
jgi:cytochrome c oxidase cbb3-type subunit 4